MHRRRVMGDRIGYVGLDVHKEGIVVAVAEGGARGEVREYGRIANTRSALDGLARKLGREGVKLRFCYEAGPCGYGIQRQLSAGGHDCIVVAPSLIPKRAGERVKTDRRDAVSLARLDRAGELTAVWVPDPGHEAMRDLVRARLDAACRAPDAPAAFGLSAAPGLPLPATDLDQAASPPRGLCGWPPACKGFSRVGSGRSLAVMCPACGRGRWPQALMGSVDRGPIKPAGSHLPHDP